MNIEAMKECNDVVLRDARRRAEGIQEEGQQVNNIIYLAQHMGDLFAEIDDLKEQVERQQSEIDDLNEQLEQKDAEMANMRQQHQAEIDNLQKQLLEAQNEHLELEKQQLEAEVSAKPMEIHNHFESGSNSQVFNGNITGCTFAMPGSTVTQQAAPAVPSNHVKRDIPAVLVACVENVREYFWKDSAMAVIFCVCRDRYGYADNMSQFERDFQCQEGLLSNTFRNNPYMRLPIDKWRENGAKERVLRLVEAYENAVQKRLSE